MAASMRSMAVNLDAPMEGWNAFDALDNMPPNSAAILDNLIPQAGKVVTRRGHMLFDQLPSERPVETVTSLNTGGSERLLVACEGGVWDYDGDDATSRNEVAAKGTYLSSRWQAGTFRRFDEETVLLLTNGKDTTQIYHNNSGNFELADIVDTGYTDQNGNDLPSAEGDGKGNGTFVGSLVFKGRAYYWKEGDDGFYYAQAGAYQGTLQRFDLGTIIQLGGSIMSMNSWTQQDSGDGKDDFLVITMTTGEVLLYQGDNPDVGGVWEIVGRYYMSEPISIRGFENLGPDLVIMTRDGYVNMSTIVQVGRTADVNQFSRLIHSAIVARTLNKFDEFGWQATLYPRDGLFIFNVPLTSQKYEQHVLNIATMRWCRFTDMNVVAMNLHMDEMFGGGPRGEVYRLLDGTSDLGNPIQFAALTAYNTFGEPGYKKHVTAAQILSTHDDPEEIKLQAYADYEIPVIERIPASDFAADEGIWSDPTPTQQNPYDPPTLKGSEWADDVDGQKGAFWSSRLNPVTTKGWQNVSAYGYAVALLVQFARVNNEVIWRNSGIRFLMGGAH